MAVHRPVIAEAELLEEHSWADQPLGRLFRLARHLPHGLAAEALQHRGRTVVHGGQRRVGHHLVEVLRDRTDILVDRPGIVVQHNDQPPGLRGDIVQRLEGDAVGERRISAERDDVLLAARHIARHGHAQRRAERRARVARAVAVVLALGAQHETVQPARLADGLEAAVAPGEHLVDIRLVAHVEDEAVARRVEDVVQRQRQLHHTQVGAKVPAGLGDTKNQPLANLFGKLSQLRNGQPLHIRRRLNPAQQLFHAHPV